MTPTLELVCTGAELLNGRSVNTHARLIARRLAPLGLALRREATVSDDPDDIAAAVRDAAARADVVLISGGLGPTVDDCTRDAVAAVLACGLHEDAETVARLQARYAASGSPWAGSRRRQALVLDPAAVLANPAGAAPGQRIETATAVLFLLPGPPGELAAILDVHVLPWLAARYPDASITERILMVSGVGESDIADRIETANLDFGAVDLAYCASPGRVEVRLTGPPEAGPDVERLAEALDRLLGGDVYARAREDLEAAVGRLLVERGLCLATAESCTGGMLASRMTECPGSSRFFRGGCVAYANEIKTALLGVSPETIERFGAVSEPAAAAMAEGARQRFGAGVAVSITGVAGPGGGTEEKPVGTVFIGLADASSTSVRRYRFTRDRTLNREWSVQRALDRLRRHLAGVAEHA